MEAKVSHEDGHVVVAAIRVLTRRQSGRPPTENEIAELIGISREWTGVLVSALERVGAVRVLTGPFEARVEVADHLALEKLPRGASTSGVEEELREFAAKRKEEEEKLRKIFQSDAAFKKQKEKMGDLADQLKSYKPKPPKAPGFFKDAPEDD